MSTDNNLGSDSSTTMTATSSGDLTWETTDLWIATGGDVDDPRIGHVVQGAGASVGIASVFFTEGSDDPEWEYDTFSLPAGETAILMFVVTGQPTNAAAAEQAGAIAALDGSVTECLTGEEAALIQNFDVVLCDTDADCDDGDMCTGAETCDAGACAEGEPLVCSGDETCDPATGCPGGTGGAGGDGGAGGAGGAGGVGGAGGGDGGSGGGCAVGNGEGNATTGVLFLAALGLLAIRRRRRA